jgi:GT2 family glycosyltransferase
LGCYAVLWHGDLAVGHFEPPLSALPMTGARLAAAIDGALEVWRPESEPVHGEPADGEFLWDAWRTRWSAVLPSRRRPDPAAASLIPAISVVICTRDRPDDLAHCLASLAALDNPPAEVLVVDNNPENQGTRAAADATAAANSWIRYVPEPRPGLDIARNTGVLAARGDIVAFVDDDVRIHPSWLEAMAAAFAGQGTDAVTGLVLPESLDTEAQYLFERYWGFNKGFRPVRYDPAWMASHSHWSAPVWDIGAGASMAFRRDLLMRIGLFDERLDAGAAGCSGDSEIWYRVLAAGGTCLYDPSIIAFHTHRRDMPGLRRQLKAYMRGHVTALLIQYERSGHSGNLRRALLGLPFYYLKLLVRGAPTGWSGRYCTLRDEFIGFLDGFRFYLTTPRPPDLDAPAQVTAGGGPVSTEPQP